MKLEFRLKMVMTSIVVLVFFVACGVCFFDGHTLIGALFALMILKKIVCLIIWDEKRQPTRKSPRPKEAHS